MIKQSRRGKTGKNRTGRKLECPVLSSEVECVQLCIPTQLIPFFRIFFERMYQPGLWRTGDDARRAKDYFSQIESMFTCSNQNNQEILILLAKLLDLKSSTALSFVLPKTNDALSLAEQADLMLILDNVPNMQEVRNVRVNIGYDGFADSTLEGALGFSGVPIVGQSLASKLEECLLVSPCPQSVWNVTETSPIEIPPYPTSIEVSNFPEQQTVDIPNPLPVTIADCVLVAPCPDGDPFGVMVQNPELLFIDENLQHLLDCCKEQKPLVPNQYLADDFGTIQEIVPNTTSPTTKNDKIVCPQSTQFGTYYFEPGQRIMQYFPDGTYNDYGVCEITNFTCSTNTDTKVFPAIAIPEGKGSNKDWTFIRWSQKDRTKKCYVVMTTSSSPTKTHIEDGPVLLEEFTGIIRLDSSNLQIEQGAWYAGATPQYRFWVVLNDTNLPSDNFAKFGICWGKQPQSGDWSPANPTLTENKDKCRRAVFLVDMVLFFYQNVIEETRREYQWYLEWLDNPIPLFRDYKISGWLGGKINQISQNWLGKVFIGKSVRFFNWLAAVPAIVEYIFSWYNDWNWESHWTNAWACRNVIKQAIYENSTPETAKAAIDAAIDAVDMGSNPINARDKDIIKSLFLMGTLEWFYSPDGETEIRGAYHNLHFTEEDFTSCY